jgi:hypothetical protein
MTFYIVLRNLIQLCSAYQLLVRSSVWSERHFPLCANDQIQKEKTQSAVYRTVQPTDTLGGYTQTPLTVQPAQSSRLFL